MTGHSPAAGLLRPRRRGPCLEDDRGSIALLLMVILVGMALGGLLVPMIITQDRTTRFDTTRVGALDAAQAGLDVMLGSIRQASSGGGSSKLPCSVTSSNFNGTASYTVAAQYYIVDPLLLPKPLAMSCTTGGTLADTAMPVYAQLTSNGSAFPLGSTPPAGSGATNGRTLTSTYQFHTTNSVGGTIQISPVSASTPPLCMDAGLPPTGGYPASASISVLMQACSTANPPLAQQTFTYRNDLTIQLVASVTSGTPSGLCLTQPTGTAVSLSSCQAPGTAPPFTQQWSYNQYGAYQTAVAKSTVNGSLGTQCINLASQDAGSQLTLAACDYNPANPVQTTADQAQSWLPSRGVGTGAATLPQWVNYFDPDQPGRPTTGVTPFGRCISVPPAITDHLWSYPCTQNPLALLVPPGQSFIGPTIVSGATSAAGTITSGSGSTKTCLTSPTNGGWVTAAPCSTGSLQTWTVYNGASTTYSVKYTITIPIGTATWCLGLGAPANTDKWSVIQTEPCTGGSDQKWNVPQNALSVTLENTEK